MTASQASKNMRRDHAPIINDNLDNQEEAQQRDRGYTLQPQDHDIIIQAPTLYGTAQRHKAQDLAYSTTKYI